MTLKDDWENGDTVTAAHLNDIADAVNAASTVVSVPASAGATGAPGQLAAESGWLYICVATNTWERVAIATW